MTTVHDRFETALTHWCETQKRAGEQDDTIESVASKLKEIALGAIHQLGMVFSLGKCNKKEIEAINLHDLGHMEKKTKMLISAVDGINMELGEIVLNVNAGRDIISCSNTGTITGHWTHSPKQDEQTAEEVIADFEKEQFPIDGVPDPMIGVVAFRAREKVIPHMRKLDAPFKLLRLKEEEAQAMKLYDWDNVSQRTKLMIDLLGRINKKTSSCDLTVLVNWYDSGAYLVAEWRKASYEAVDSNPVEEE